MRIRATKPEFWQSSTIAKLTWDTRLVLKALESYVDDNGVGKDSVVIFCTAAFPHDLIENPEVFAKVSRSLGELSERNLIVRYNVAGEDLIYVRRWKQLQYIDKPKAGRYPRPDGTMHYREVVDETIGAGQSVDESSVTEQSRGVREDFAKTTRNLPEDCPPIQSGEQGNRGTEQKNPPTPVEYEPEPPEPYSGRRTGAEIARAKFSMIPSHGSQLAREIVTAYSDSLDTPIDARTAREIAEAVDGGIQAGQSPEAIAAGIEDWAKSDSFSPKQIPKYITKASARRRNNGVGKPTLKAVQTGQLAEELIAEMGDQ